MKKRRKKSSYASKYLEQYDLHLGNIVFEVTEKNAVDDVKGFKDIIRHYKLQGYNIVVDDAGSCMISFYTNKETSNVDIKVEGG